MTDIKQAFKKLLTIQELSAQKRDFATICKYAGKLYWILERIERELDQLAAARHVIAVFVTRNGLHTPEQRAALREWDEVNE